MAENGTFIKVKIGTKEFVGELSNSLNATADIINLSSKASGYVSKKIGGRVSNSLSFESLCDDTNSTDYGYGDAHAAMKARTLLAFTIIKGVATLHTGSGILSSLTKTTPDNDRTTMSGTVEIKGNLT
jgi:hypothetical protein